MAGDGWGLLYVEQTKDSILDRKREPFGRLDKHVKLQESFKWYLTEHIGSQRENSKRL